MEQNKEIIIGTPVYASSIRTIGTIDLNEDGWLTIQVKLWPELNAYMVYLESDEQEVCFVEFKKVGISEKEAMLIARQLAKKKLQKIIAIIDKEDK